MTKYIIGVDSGSTMCKSVLFDGEKIVDTLVVKTGWNPKLSSEESISSLLTRNGIKRSDVCLSTTGYGREAIPDADYTFTEITCHAHGGMYLAPDVQGLIDIGGQDSKVIQIQNNRVVNFLMNDKCAAGTGRFLNMACDRLEVNIEEIDSFVDENESVAINSMCTVFAESEITGLLAMQKDRSKIMAGILESIAKKIQQQVGKVDFDQEKPLLMTGGLSKSKAIIKTISKIIGYEVITDSNALFAGALGACICAYNKMERVH